MSSGENIPQYAIAYTIQYIFCRTIFCFLYDRFVLFTRNQTEKQINPTSPLLSLLLSLTSEEHARRVYEALFIPPLCVSFIVHPPEDLTQDILAVIQAEYERVCHSDSDIYLYKFMSHLSLVFKISNSKILKFVWHERMHDLAIARFSQQKLPCTRLESGM